MVYHPNPAVDRLLVRKTQIDQRINDELRRPMPDAMKLQKLKRVRLSLKDRVVQLMRTKPYDFDPALAQVG